MRRTLILTALGATTLSIGLGVGATLASANTAPRGPTITTMLMANGNGDSMHDGSAMTQMMGSTGMGSGINTDDMNAMHTMMHAAMSDHMSTDQLAQCDSAHGATTDGQSSSSVPRSGNGHTEHHQGIEP